MKLPNISRQVSTRGMYNQIEKRSKSAAMRYLFRVHMQGCLRRGVVNALSIEEYARLTTETCCYCGRPPFNKTKLRAGVNIIYNGVDRINNAKAYQLGNVVACCKDCNSMKSKLGADEFILHVFRIARFQAGVKANFLEIVQTRMHM